jgi:uncharacterized protein YgbK (DUF1537 family)
VTLLDVDADFADADVVAIDANTRAGTESAATAKAASLARRFNDAGRAVFFKKIDSTLRGHVGAELAATLHALRRGDADRHRLAILSPAFPKLGRTTIDGRQRLHGRPLEETETWQREQSGRTSSLLDRVQEHGLAARLIPLQTIRQGAEAVHAAMHKAAPVADVVVCDTEVDTDLQTISQAARRLDVPVLWVGSAGLVGHLAATLGGSRRKSLCAAARRGDAPFLFVVGTPSAVSRRQVARLAAAGVPGFTFGDRGHGSGPEACAVRVEAALRNGRDVLLATDDAGRNAQESRALTAALGRIAAGCSERIGGIFVTGGETARSVLEQMHISALRHVTEIEPGVPLSMAVGPRVLPIITKAGAFGDDDTLLRCRQALHGLHVADPEATLSTRKAAPCHSH